jgi:hypothetical protein
MSTTRLSHDQRGLSLVELVVVMVLTLAFSGMVISFALDYWGSATSLKNDSETFVTRQNLGDVLRDRLNVASGLITQNSLPDLNTHLAEVGDVSGTHWVVQHAIPKTIPLPPPNQFLPVIYYTAPSVTSAKVPIMNGAQPFYDEFILYLEGSTKKLYLRNLVNPGASANRLRTTCPPATATTICPSDKLVASDVTSVTTRYFSRSGNLIDWTSMTDPLTGAYIGPDFPSVEVVELTINLGRKAIIKGAQDTGNQTIVRVALRNG